MSDVQPRRWSFWLIASLCLNLFLIGLLVVGLVVARKRMIASEISGGGMAPETVLTMLPPSGQVKMCNVLSGQGEAYRRLGAEIVDARRDMYRAYNAEPFDEAAFAAAQKRLTEAQIGLIRERAASSTAVTAQLTAGERKHFAKEIARRYLSPDKPETPRRRPGALTEACAKVGVTLAK